MCPMRANIYFSVAGHIACGGLTEPIDRQGETEPPMEEVIIKWELSDSSYDEDGNIIMEDDRITPTTFQYLYLMIGLPDQKVGYYPLHWFAVSLEPKENKLEPQTLAITNGRIVIVDPDKFLLTIAREFFFEDPEFLANLPWPQEFGRLRHLKGKVVTHPSDRCQRFPAQEE